MNLNIQIPDNSVLKNDFRTHLKRKDACFYLSCAPNTLDKYCTIYSIYPIKIGGVNYYNKSDLERLFQVKHQ